MEEIILEDGRVAVPYTRSNEKHTFSDAIVMTPEERATKTDQELNEIMDQRFAKWLNVIGYTPEA